MKKLTALVLVSICVLGLCACGSSDVPPPPPEAYAFEAQYIRTDGYSEERSYPYHVVINSKEELVAYYEANKELFDLERKDNVYSDTTIGFLDACDKYADTFFERQNLVLIVFEEGSGSIRHEITDVRRRWDENGASLGWNITINRIVPEVGTDDMAQWHLFLEVQMGDVIKSDDDVWINDKLSNNASDDNTSATEPTTNTDSTEPLVGYPLPDKRVWDWHHPDDSEKNPYFSISVDNLGGALIEQREDDAEIYVNGERLLGGPGNGCTSFYLADITGDGKYELCFGMSTGSGIVDCNIVVFDYETKECIFSLSDRTYHDYFLFVRNGVLCVMETEYMQREPIRTGMLINDGAGISVAWDSKVDASYDRDN